MKWHAMTFALHLCTGNHVELGVSAWLGSILCLVLYHGKSTLGLVFEVCRKDMINRHCVWCSMVSSIKWDNVQIEAHGCIT